MTFSDFPSALAAAGIPLSGAPTIDDRIHRYQTQGDHDPNCWYVLHQFGDLTVGAFGCWKRQISEKWSSRNGSSLTKEERQDMARTWREQQALRATEEARLQGEAREIVRNLMSQCPSATGHPYMTAKGVRPHGRMFISTQEATKDWLMVPLQDVDGVVHSAQFIADDGTKKFLYGGRVKGCFFVMSDTLETPLIICEGYATGASIHEATGWAVVCATSCGNLLDVAQALRAKEPQREIIVAADDDQFSEGNPGRTKAEVAAKAIQAHVAIPEFPDECIGERPTDFNDLHRLSGLDQVRRQLQRANPVVRLLLDREFNPNIEPPPLRPIYSLADVPISTPGNLTTITAAVKTGKTAVLGAMMASAMPHTEDADLLGFTSDNRKERALLLFDSEQSPDDFWRCIMRAMKRAGLRRPPPWLHPYRLTGLGCKRAWEAVAQAIRMVADQHGGIHSMMMDGFADLVADVNDPEESNALVATIHDLAIRHDCPVVGVIHFNPGTEKSRGHLGSQLERKAETNLALDKDTDETTVIFSTKNRRAGIPKATGPRFKFSAEAGMHVSVESRKASKDHVERENLLALAEDIFGDHPAMHYTDIQVTVKNRLTVSDKTAQRRVDEMRRLTVIKQSAAGLYVIARKHEPK